jgi:hypothetical protein
MKSTQRTTCLTKNTSNQDVSTDTAVEAAVATAAEAAVAAADTAAAVEAAVATAAEAAVAADTNEGDTKSTPPFSFSFFSYLLEVIFFIHFHKKYFSLLADLRTFSFRAKRDDASASITVKSCELHASGFRSERAIMVTLHVARYSPRQIRNPNQAFLSLTNPKRGLHVI